MKKLILFFLIFLSTQTLFAQGVDCNTADPFCTGTSYTFPASTNVPSLGQVGCLYTTPNPAWYFFQIANTGPLTIYMASTPAVDIDFICWGPFTSLANACASNLMANAGISCSYSTSWNETCSIPNGISGEFYVLLITNYSNQVCNINFSQTGGTGSTNCGILAPPISGDTVCVGETIQFTVNNPTPGATYSWTGPGGWTSSQINPSIPNATIGMSGTYSMTITLGGQTSPAVTCNVLVNPNPIITITPANPTTCSGVATNLTGNSTGPNTTYLWSNGSVTNPTTVNPTTPTVYIVTGTDANGCIGTASVQVNINPDLVVSVNPAAPMICIGGSIVLTASGGDNYTWSPSGSLSCSNCAVVTASPITTTTYTVVAIDTAGCTGSTTVTVTASPGPNIEIFQVDPVICRGDTSMLTVNGASNCTWSPVYGLNSASGNVVIASPLNTVTYTVTGDNNGCLGTGEVTVTVSLTPLVDFTADVKEGCENLWVNFTDNTTPAVHEWIWNFGDNTSVSSSNYFQNPKHLFDAPGTYDVSLTVVSDDGCAGGLIIPQMITIHKNPVADFIYNPMVSDELNQYVWFSDQSIDADFWYWNFGENFTLGNTSNEPYPTHEYAGVGTYLVTLAIETTFGCVDTIRKPVVIEPLITFYAPNSFTPNNDGHNDKFYGMGVGIDESSFEMRIYDRWGMQMFFTADIYKGWDGRVMGQEKVCPAGVFTYFVNFIDIKGNRHVYKGNVNLLR